LLVVDLPNPVRISRNPYFGEGNELAAGLARFVDEVNGLANTALKIKPGGLRSDLWMCQTQKMGKGG
jgi:hypothetical protein